MRIEVLGTGCAKCKKLHAEADEAVHAFGRPVEVVKVQELQAIMAYGVRATPALVLDGQVRAAGRIPAASEILGWLREAQGGGGR